MSDHARAERKAYLFLLARPSPAVRREAARALGEMGLNVTTQHGSVALVALASAEEAAAAQDLGLFSAVLSGPMKTQHLDRLNDEQRAILRLWNARFTRGYRTLKEDTSLRGRSWGHPEMGAPAPYSPVAPEDFLPFVDEWERRHARPAVRPREGGPSQKGGAGRKRPARRMDGEAFAEFERSLADVYGDPTIAHHLSRLAYQLGPDWYDRFPYLDPEFLKEFWDRFFQPEATCWELTGEISVGLVFVESSRSGGPKFGATERNEVCNEILDGLSFLATEHPGGSLSWVIDLQFTTIDAPNGVDNAANCPSLSSLEAAWRDPAMAQVNYNGNTYTAAWSSVADYREDMRTANRSAHALVIFVTPYANCWHAYAGGARCVLANRNNWGGWGRSTIDVITAHEVSHLFGSADEYTGSGTPCSTCDSRHGCDQIPNGNCGACAHPRQDCMMDQNSKRICPWTRGHIGWSHLFVELTTADELWSGTDDDVWVDIGDRSFVLDTANHDDRERNSLDGYPTWAPDLRREDIGRIMIRKSPDGFAGGWKLGGLRAWFGSELICDQPSINRWLEDDHRTWVSCVSDRDLVISLVVRITTADVGWAGTDDDVSITLAGRTWNLDNAWHDDFERGNTDSFTLDPGTGLHVSGIHSVAIHKSPDGFAGGWKLKGVEVVANGASIFSSQSINQWLEDDHRDWSASF
jgi:hypothetical protein